MANTIQIKRTITTTAPDSNTGGGGNVITVGELAYSYSSGDGSGNESGTGKLYIGHPDGIAGSNSAAIIAGSFFTSMLDHSKGTATANSAVLLDGNLHSDVIKTTALSLGSSGSATLVTSTAAELNILDGATLDVTELNILDGITSSTAELNKLDGVTSTTAELNYVDVTAGSATASKAVVLNANSHINTVKTATLHIGASGSETQVTSSATELNLLDGITAIDADLSTVAGTHTTLTSALAVKTYVDNTRSGLEVKDSVVASTTANLSATYANGTAGVGATLTNSGSQAAFAIDGITLTASQRVLIKDQSTATQNGVYQVTTVGDGSTN